MTIVVGGRPCVRGFDWSYWQPVRDMAAAVAEGNQFGIIKASEGDNYRDPRYGAHVDACDATGLIVGAYHFARPDASDGGPYGDGRQEARLFLSLIDDRIDFAVLDLEASVLSPADTTAYVFGWWDQIAESGRFPTRSQRVTYVGKYFAWQHAIAVAGTSVLWLPSYTAGYTPNVDPARIGLPGWSDDLWPEGWALWQYSSSGTVAGVSPSDVNVATVEWFDQITTRNEEDNDMPSLAEIEQLFVDQDTRNRLYFDGVDGEGGAIQRGAKEAGAHTVYLLANPDGHADPTYHLEDGTPINLTAVLQGLHGLPEAIAGLEDIVTRIESGDGPGAVELAKALLDGLAARLATAGPPGP
jgi:GH25 family lysozyme M1 (1,4-beta-N-acetylmuramidase)